MTLHLREMISITTMMRVGLPPVIQFVEVGVSKGMTCTTCRVRKTILENHKINDYQDKEAKQKAKGHTASKHPGIFSQ